MLTLDLIPGPIWDLVLPTSGSKEILCDGVIPINLVIDLGQRNDGMHIFVGLYDCLLLRSTTAVEPEQPSPSDILNRDIGAIGVGQRRIDRIARFRKVRGVVPDSVSN